MLRGITADGKTMYSALTGIAQGDNRLNINPLTHVSVSTISPNGLADRLWESSADIRTTAIADRFEHTREAVSNAVFPVAEALEFSSRVNFANDDSSSFGSEVSELLRNVDSNVHEAQNVTMFTLSSARTPTLISLWNADDTQINQISISAQNLPFLIAPSVQAIQESYEQVRREAEAGINMNNFDHDAASRAIENMQRLIREGNYSMDQVWIYYKDFLLAMGMPNTLVSHVVASIRDGDINDAFKLVADFFGSDSQQFIDDVLNEYRNIKVNVEGIDYENLVATVMIDNNGVITYDTYSLPSQFLISKGVREKDYSKQCIVSRYTGSDKPTSSEEFVRNSEAFNQCDFPINFATCVWRSGNIGPENSGCETATRTGVAGSRSYLGVRGVVYGPLGESNAFVACKAPARPVSTGKMGGTGGYSQLWQCMG